MERTEERVKEVIVELLGLDDTQVINTANLEEDLFFDSLDAIELVMAFEETYDFEISDEDAECFKTVGDIVEFIVNNTLPKGIE